MRYSQVMFNFLELDSDYVTPYFDDVDAQYTVFMYQTYGLEAATELCERLVEDYTGNLDSEN